MSSTVTPEQTRIDRLATVARAVERLTRTSPEVLREQLASTTIHDHWKQDPRALAARLATAGTPGAEIPVFSAWQGARSVLRAAGLPD
ncbi:hypothetical protein [Streptomyces sp. NBC_01304]|uniref:hypothetical protein n=1 Tax=Streptomyces sp. NBC_01304 TaxID=2903818 RepID=UPI002E15506F|nr:hypothetical protein OG430_48715 [Streptomyces sp. NBC_01304]